MTVAPSVGGHEVMGPLRRAGWRTYTATSSRLRVPAVDRPADATGPVSRWSSRQVRRALLEDAAPFWERHVPDLEAGGFWCHLSHVGDVLGTDKHTIAQARWTYAFAVLWSLSGDPQHLAMAEHGRRFLQQHAWDTRHGGWFRSVDRHGEPGEQGKWVVDQAYVVICLAEYARLTGDHRLDDRLVATHELVETLWDRQNDGYGWMASRDWRVEDARKSSCVQIDMLLAVMLLAERSGDGALLDRTAQLAGVLLRRMRTHDSHVLLEWFTPEWAYLPRVTRDSLVVGHPLKAMWELSRAADLLGDDDVREGAMELLPWCRRTAWDPSTGTFVSDVYRDGRPARAARNWWTQCEGMLALVTAHRHTRDDRDLDMLHGLLTGTLARYTDRSNGGWWGSRRPTGDPPRHLPKQWQWKAGYHVAQSLAVVSTYLEELEAGTESARQP